MSARSRVARAGSTARPGRLLRGAGAVLSALVLVLTHGDAGMVDDFGRTTLHVATGEHHTVVLTTGGRLYAWGSNSSGQLGDGTTTSSATPVQVDTSGVLDGVEVTAVAAGRDFTLAIGADGRAYGWGQNADGQLGDGTAVSSSVPVAVDTSGVLAGVQLASIAGGSYHSVALSTDGRAYAWGRRGTWLGDGGALTTSRAVVAVDTSGLLDGVRLAQVSAGFEHTVALGSDGRGYAWGKNTEGQLGIGGTRPAGRPVAVEAPGGPARGTFLQVAAGRYHTVALGSDLRVYTAGNDSLGQLGNGTGARVTTLTAVGTAGVLDGVAVTRVAAGTYSTIVSGSDGQLYAWGLGQRDESGQPGARLPAAVHVDDALRGLVTQISAGFGHVVVLRSAGWTYAWGLNQDGQLGDGTTTSRAVDPVRVPAGGEPLG